MQLIDGRWRVGRLENAPDSAALLMRSADGSQALKVADVLQVAFRPEPPYRVPDPGAVLLTGDRLAGRIGITEGRQVTVHTRSFGAVKLRLDQVATLVLASPAVEPVSKPEPPGCVLANQTVVAGPLRWLSAKVAAIDSPVLGLVEVPRERVQQCVLAPVVGGTAADQRAELRLTNGDLLTGRLLGLGATSVVLETPALGRRSIPIDRVQRVRFLGGRVRPLTDLKPTEVKRVPFFDAVLPPRLGTSVGGRPIRIGARRYVTGWGVESRTELTFRLDGRYDYFRADVGIDEEVGDGGRVVFLVELDGTVAYKTGAITGAMEAVPVHVSVAGAKVMRLIVDFGGDAHVRDHADWAEPILMTAR